MITAPDAVPVIVGLAIGIVFLISISLLFDARPSSEAVENAVITIERTVCFGSCPDYALTIYGNGTVNYEGRNFVAVTGTRTASISSGNVRELVNNFYDIHYFSLRDKYVDQVSDLPTTTTSISVDGRFKKIVDYYGAPVELMQLENRIDQIANSDMWVKGSSNNQ